MKIVNFLHGLNAISMFTIAMFTEKVFSKKIPSIASSNPLNQLTTFESIFIQVKMPLTTERLFR